jgi:hypothetical protein
MKKGSAVFLSMVLIGGIRFASADSLDSIARIITPSGWAWTNFGQIVHGHWNGPNGNGTGIIEHEWCENLGGGLGLNATAAKRLQARFAVEIASRVNYSGLVRDADYQIRQREYSIYVDEACGAINLGNPDDPLLRISAGYFQYKYNPEVKNLGEYLFRTGVFPGYVLNLYDWPKTRLLGIRINTARKFSAGSAWGDLLLTNETDFPMPPTKDYSLSAIGGIDLAGIINAGIGAQYMNLISVNSELTTPHRLQMDTTENQYFPAGTHMRPDDTSHTVSGRKFYSFAGVKVMGRLCFDPKGLFSSGILGKEDLKIYAEAAVLGFDDYTLYQSDTTWHTIPLEDRIPVMIGFNIPAFKALDAFSFELEYYGCPYSLDVLELLNRGRPSSSIDRQGAYNPSDWRADDIKWSLYAKRSFYKFFTVIGQVARDHYFMYSYANGVIRQTITQQDDWHWDIKLLYAF